MNGVSKLKNLFSTRYAAGYYARTQFLLKFRLAHTAAKSDSEIEPLTKQEAKVGHGAGGITVASIENYSPISQVSVVVKAGSKYENSSNLGIAHCIRNCSALSTKKQSKFSITRGLEIKGAKINVTSSREYIIYTLECIREEIDSTLEFLADVSTNPAFKTWEVDDSLYGMQLDLAMLNANVEAVLMETLHKAAFRGGLGNSLYSPSFMIGRHSSEMLHTYMKDNFTAARTSIVGLGIDHDHLQSAVDKLFNLDSHSGSEVAPKFGGGDIRIESDIPFVHTAIVAEGSGLLNAKDALSLGVLQCILGSTPNSKFGGSAFSKLGEAASKFTDNPFAVSCLNINYADTGLFGVMLCGVPDDMKHLVKSVVSQMRDVTKSITDSDIQTAKYQLKTKLRLAREKSKDFLLTMILDTCNFGQIRDIKDIEKSIDELKATDISSVASRVMKTKPAMASIGRLHSTPYIDELI